MRSLDDDDKYLTQLFDACLDLMDRHANETSSNSPSQEISWNSGGALSTVHLRMVYDKAEIMRGEVTRDDES